MCTMLFTTTRALHLVSVLSVRRARRRKLTYFAGELILNDTAHARPVQLITVKNKSKMLQRYSISHAPAGTTTSFDSEQQAIHYPVPLNTNYARVSFSTKTLTVHPGESVSFFATILPPTGVDPKVFPVYSGFIRIARKDGLETVNVPYLGVAAKMKDMKVIDTTDYCE